VTRPPGSAAARAALTDRAVAAARAVAARHGLETGDPEVLSQRGNVVVRLAPHRLVARVGTLAALTRRDSGSRMRREVEVVPGGRRPWRPGGGAGSAARPRPAPARRALAVVLGGRHRGTLPVLTPAREQVTDSLELLTGPPGTSVRQRLREEHHRSMAALAAYADHPLVVLHGDAHPGNVLAVRDGWLWVDLEEACRGPALWDLAVASGGPERSAAADQVLAAYEQATGTPAATEVDRAPFRRARLLESVTWTLRWRRSTRSATPGRPTGS
jgi:hypothetical protein